MCIVPAGCVQYNTTNHSNSCALRIVAGRAVCALVQVVVTRCVSEWRRRWRELEQADLD